MTDTANIVITKKDVSLNTTNNVYMTINQLNTDMVALGGKGDKSGKTLYNAAEKLYKQASEIVSAQLDKLKSAEDGKFPLTVKNAIKIDWTANKATVGYSRSFDELRTFDKKDDFTKWRESDCEKIYTKQLEQMKNNLDVYAQEDIKRADAASAFSKLLADDTFNKIRELEKDLEYRKFYFPGGVAKLKQVPPGQVGPLGDKWDPRYLVDYIEQARANGFHNWFLKPKLDEHGNVTYIEPCNVMKVWNRCKTAIDWRNKRYISNGNSKDFKEVVSMFVGMAYMGKFEALSNYIDAVSEGDLTIYDITLKDIYDTFGRDVVSPMREKLVAIVGQTNFVEDDFGYYAQIDKLAFDAQAIVDELKVNNAKYEKFKKQLWDILSKNPVLQLCTNNAQITGNNIKITQTMECKQSIIGDEQNNGDGEDEEEEDEEEETTETPAATPTTTTAPTTQTKAKKESKKNNDEPPTPDPDESKMKTSTIIIIIVVAILVVGGGLVGLWFFMQKKEQVEEVMNGGFVMLA